MANVTRYKTSKGETRYRVRYRKPDGTQTDKRGFKRKVDAENWAAKRVTVAKAEGTYIDPQAGKATVGELAPAWLAKKKLSTKPSHYRNLEGAWEKWVKPEWGNTPVSAVTRETVQQWVTGISQGKTVKDERGNEIVLRPVREQGGGEFAEQILADLIAQGFSGDQLLTEFKKMQKKVRPAVEAMLTQAEQAARGESESSSYEDVFGTEEE